MKKLLSFMLAFITILALAVPVMGSPGFSEGSALEITERDYDAIDVKEFALNDSSIQVEGLGIFYSDNSTLNSWYLDVTEDVEGTINIAYKIGSKYFNAKFAINGPGLYRVGDGRGSNRVHSVKIGAFEKKPPLPTPVTSAPQVTSAPPVASEPGDTKNPSEPVITYEIADGWNPNILDQAYNHQAHAFIFFVNKLENGVVVATNKHVQHFRVPQGSVIISYDEGYSVRFEWDDHIMISVTIVEQRNRKNR